MSETDDTIKRIQSHKGVTGCIISNQEGIPIKSNLDNSTTVQYCGNFTRLAQLCRQMVRDMDPSDDCAFLRIRTRRHEIMIAPDKDYQLMVIQNPSE